MTSIFKQETITVWKFKPQADITAYELAQVLIYMDKSAWHQMPMTSEIVKFPQSVAFPEVIARHFEQVNERQVQVPHIQDTRIWEDGSIGELRYDLSKLLEDDLASLAADLEDLDAPV